MDSTKKIAAVATQIGLREREKSDRMKKGKEKEKEAYDLLHPGFFARMTGGGGDGDQMLAVSAYKNAAIEYKAANAADVRIFYSLTNLHAHSNYFAYLRND